MHIHYFPKGNTASYIFHGGHLNLILRWFWKTSISYFNVKHIFEIIKEDPLRLCESVQIRTDDELNWRGSCRMKLDPCRGPRCQKSLHNSDKWKMNCKISGWSVCYCLLELSYCTSMSALNTWRVELDWCRQKEFAKDLKLLTDPFIVKSVWCVFVTSGKSVAVTGAATCGKRK